MNASCFPHEEERRPIKSKYEKEGLPAASRELLILGSWGRWVERVRKAGVKD